MERDPKLSIAPCSWLAAIQEESEKEITIQRQISSPLSPVYLPVLVAQDEVGILLALHCISEEKFLQCSDLLSFAQVQQQQ
jgi:hypothetical protein